MLKLLFFQVLLNGALLFLVSVLTLDVCLNVVAKNTPIVEDIQGYSLKNITSYLTGEFTRTSDEELGISVIKDIYSKFKYTSALQDIPKVLSDIANKLDDKLNAAIELVTNTKKEIEALSNSNETVIQSALTPCIYNEDIRLWNLDGNHSYINTDITLNLKQVLEQKIRSSKKLRSNTKQLYFLSANDLIYNDSTISHCEGQDHSLLWGLYMGRANPKPRNVMLLLDYGGSLSKQQFEIVKAVAKQMIAVLNINDKVGLLAISDEWNAPYLSDQCLMPNQIAPISDTSAISPATERNKYLLNKYIDSLVKGIGVTNHSLGFQQALSIIKTSRIPFNESIMLLYISRGLLSSLTEAKTVLETISSSCADIENIIIINTCAVIDGSKPIMYERHFLGDIAAQNYSKYNIETLHQPKKGVMLSVHSKQTVGLAVTRFYNVLGYFNNITNEPELTLPMWDNVAQDLSVAITVPIIGLSGYIGLLGINLMFSSIAEDIIYYTNYHYYTYAFIINTEGLTLMHPSYSRPASINKQPKYVDILYLETLGNFKEVRKRLLDQAKGSYLLSVENDTLEYAWKRVRDWYIVCVVIHLNQVPPVTPHKVAWYSASSITKLIHHRLDILPVMNLCRHLNQMATLDAGSVYLSPSCFKSPYSYAHFTQDETLSSTTVQNYMAYLKDNTRMLTNPGLKDEVRDDVVALAHILEFLHLQHISGPRAKYIVRRYVTSPNGVLQIFPGSFVAPGIEPTRRIWYLRAVENRFKTIVTPPYLDAGGAGYIVTLAYATAHVVAAMDVTYGYIYKLMLQHMPFCSNRNIKCFMMDDQGYLVYHPNLIDPNGHGPIEQQHIIHKESLVANAILNHKNFVKKMLCNNYVDDTVQRYYRLNTSLDDVIMNTVHGEQCVKYQVGAIGETNVFVGMVNATCEVAATFCPCSMIDRLCLNCNRMEQRECECPCECPINLDICTHPNRAFLDNPLCSVIPEQTFSFTSHFVDKVDKEIKSCIPVICEAYITYESCLGILGCEWCQFDVDGENYLTNPFCTSFTTCFNGVLGSVTPYGDLTGGVSSENIFSSSYTSVGPVVGSIIVIGLVLGFMFFCYRTYSSPIAERFYLTSTQHNQGRMGDFNISDDFQEVDNHWDKLLQETKKVELVSPYCVSSSYRRPLTVVDSDHGYSTMTPHDESEHLSFAPVEIDSLDDCTSDAASINTSVSSKQQKCYIAGSKTKIRAVPELTDLQNISMPNKIITSVTVHRNMEIAQ